jgi:bifunctional DNase/RNase
MPQEPVVIAIKGLMSTTNGWAVFLGNEEKIFVIYVDPFVGNAIQMTLNGVRKERPLTHDLIGSILLGFGARLDHVVINDSRQKVVNNATEKTFFARIFLRIDSDQGRKIVEIDARPSDSIVLALQQKRPIYVARPVFDSVDDQSEFLERLLKREAEESEEGGEGEPGEDQP